MQYIAARRARFNAICGPVNIPYGTTVEAVDGFLERDGLRLCAATSESAHKYFARDSDGHGLERGKLTAATGSGGQSCGRIPWPAGTGGRIMRIFGCGPMTFSRPPWRTCGILPG